MCAPFILARTVINRTTPGSELKENTVPLQEVPSYDQAAVLLPLLLGILLRPSCPVLPQHPHNLSVVWEGTCLQLGVDQFSVDGDLKA